MTFFVMKMLVDDDSELFDSATDEYQKNTKQEQQLRNKVEAQWRTLEHKVYIKNKFV